jgi:hypothetical protein
MASRRTCQGIKGSPIEEAILYTYNRFNKLSRYHLDGRCSIDNNGIENVARPVAVGRKNIYSVKMTIWQKAQLLFL